MELMASGIYKTYNGRAVLHDVTLHIKKNEIHALVGPSGTGKTTLLKCIAGMIQPDNGTITLGGTDITDTNVRKRKIGFVFQEYALFPHLTTFQNIAYGLKASGVRKGEIECRCHEMLALTGLEEYRGSYPDELSGGQQQRLALARSLVLKPGLLLMDEPFAHCDVLLRMKLAGEIRHILKNTGTSALFVTHNPDDAAEVADSVSILSDGAVAERGSVSRIARHPQTEYAGMFSGGFTELNVRIIQSDSRTTIGCVSAGNVKRRITLKTYPYYYSRKSCKVGLRSADVKITAATSGENCFTGTVLSTRPSTGGYQLEIDLSGIRITGWSSSHFHQDDSVSVYLPPDSFYPLCGRAAPHDKKRRICREEYI